MYAIRSYYALYARGMTTREIQGHLEEIYGVDVSPTLISNITDAVIDEVKAWQSRPLESVYPIVYLDAIVVKSRQDGRIRNKSVYLALGRITSYNVCYTKLLRLAVDELDDVGMLGVQDDHLGGTARLAARLDDAGKRVVPLHEGDRAGRGPATGE